MTAPTADERDRMDALNVMFRVYGDLVKGRVYYSPDHPCNTLIGEGPNKNFLSGGSDTPFTLAVQRNGMLENHTKFPPGSFYVFKHFTYMSLVELLAQDIFNEVMLRHAAA
jgi:hypothetical protein